MFGLGIGELIVILVVALLVLGPDKLPDAARTVGKGLRDLRRHTRDLERTIEEDSELSSTVREIKSALRGEDPPPPRGKPPGAGDGAKEPAAATAKAAPGEAPDDAPEPPATSKNRDG